MAARAGPWQRRRRRRLAPTTPSGGLARRVPAAQQHGAALKASADFLASLGPDPTAAAGSGHAAANPRTCSSPRRLGLLALPPPCPAARCRKGAAVRTLPPSPSSHPMHTRCIAPGNMVRRMVRAVVRRLDWWPGTQGQPAGQRAPARSGSAGQLGRVLQRGRGSGRLRGRFAAPSAWRVMHVQSLFLLPPCVVDGVRWGRHPLVLAQEIPVCGVGGRASREQALVRGAPSCVRP